MSAEFTGVELRDLLEQARVIQGSHKKLGKAAIEELAAEIGLLRWCHEKGCLVAEAERKTLQDALEAAFDALPAVMTSARALGAAEEHQKLVQLHEAIAAFAPGPCMIDPVDFPGAREQYEQNIKGVRVALEWKVAPDVQPGPRHNTQAWHKITKPLTAQFVAAMAEANPGMTLGLSNDGPLARYLAAVIPMITGEKPSANAIARHLQRGSQTV